jgi:putative membrane protein
VKYMSRWIANSIALFLGLYLVDSLIAPRFWIKSWWIGVILAVLLGALNSLIRPLHRLRSRTQRSLTVTFATLVMNFLILQIFIWMGAPLSATSIVWVLVAAAFVSVLSGMLNWLIGFKKKEKPGTSTRERAARVPRARG